MKYMKNDSVSILVLYTGGTIGMKKDPATGTLVPFDFDNVYEHLPMLRQLDYNIDVYSFSPLIDSSNMTPEFWIRLAEKIRDSYDSYDGFVVLHGSDTMAYTASALSFMLENLGKPVIFTGSQLPMDEVRTDGRENFLSAIEIAASRENGVPVVPEVAVFFQNQLLRGNRTTKFNAEHFSAFATFNYPPLAEAGVHIRYNRNLILKANGQPLMVHTKLDSNVCILKLFPGITENVVRSTLNITGLKALIIETFGSGNAPTAPWFISTLAEAIRKGLVVFNVTQCKSGSVEQGRYQTSHDLDNIGVIGGYDITTESALAKLMYLLGEGYTGAEIRHWLSTPLRGEMDV